MHIFSMFFACFGAVPLNTKNGEEGHPPPFFSFFGRVQKAVSLNTKNGAEGHRAFFLPFLRRIQKRCHAALKMKQRDTGPF